MVNWSEICPVLKQVFTTLATDQLESPSPEWRAEWHDRHCDYNHPEQELALYLRVTSCVGIGEDETRYDEVVEDDAVVDVTERQCGLRRFVLNVQAELTETEDGKSAINTLERIRTRLRRTSILGELLDVDVALVEVGSVQNISLTFDSRAWSVASMDVTFCAAVNDSDPVPTGWIERIVISSDVDGASTQLTDEELPDSPPAEDDDGGDEDEGPTP